MKTSLNNQIFIYPETYNVVLKLKEIFNNHNGNLVLRTLHIVWKLVVLVCYYLPIETFSLVASVFVLLAIYAIYFGIWIGLIVLIIGLIGGLGNIGH